MSDAAIEVHDLSKRYRLGQIGATTLRESAERLWHRLLGRDPHRHMGVVSDVTPGDASTTDGDHIWALRDVSFEVNRGEVIGVIGKNGAGKSTLLKILTRITEPTSGMAVMRGRVGSLLEVGTGFHPDLTGRENTYLNGAILGMRKKEIDRKFDGIVAFAEVEKFIDTPVKRYSSGMYVRLAFAVAAHLETQILLVDEVLAVGDVAFQKKCLGKMGEVAEAGRTVLFVSHNLAAVEGLCSRCILLDAGELVVEADVGSAIETYIQRCFGSEGVRSLLDGGERTGTGKIYFTGVAVEDEDGNELPAIRCGQDVEFVFRYATRGDACRNVSVGFGLISEHGQVLFVHYNDYSADPFSDIPGQGEFRCKVRRFPLAPGRYKVGGRIVANRVETDWPRQGIGFVAVTEGDFYSTGSVGWREVGCPFLIDADWSVHETDARETPIQGE